jgi:mono/diheme cytochrome c family protein
MARSFTLALVALALALAGGCGGGDTVTPEPENVEGSVAQETLPSFEGGDPEAGRQVFTETAQPTCGSCHTFGPADTDADVGPNLDDSLGGDSPETVYTNIIDPDEEVTEGFSDQLMPEDYGEKLEEQQLVDLVAFLTQGS